MTAAVADKALETAAFAPIWRQVVEGLDGERLLPSREKRVRDLEKKLDRPLENNGWRMFVSGCAHTLAQGKARLRRDGPGSGSSGPDRQPGLQAPGKGTCRGGHRSPGKAPGRFQFGQPGRRECAPLSGWLTSPAGGREPPP